MEIGIDERHPWLQGGHRLENPDQSRGLAEGGSRHVDDTAHARSHVDQGIKGRHHQPGPAYHGHHVSVRIHLRRHAPGGGDRAFKLGALGRRRQVSPFRVAMPRASVKHHLGIGRHRGAGGGHGQGIDLGQFRILADRHVMEGPHRRGEGFLGLGWGGQEAHDPVNDE